MYIVLQATAPDAAAAPQLAEQTGITPDVVQRLQEKASVLTQERKQRGRTVPEDLATHEVVRTYQQLASHPVRNLYV